LIDFFLKKTIFIANIYKKPFFLILTNYIYLTERSQYSCQIVTNTLKYVAAMFPRAELPPGWIFIKIKKKLLKIYTKNHFFLNFNQLYLPERSQYS
jgi:hypothetical protein